MNIKNGLSVRLIVFANIQPQKVFVKGVKVLFLVIIQFKLI